MPSALRSVLAVVLGLVAFVVVVGLGEAVNSLIYPLPPGIDPSKPVDLAKVMDVMPTGALVGVVLSWTLAAFVGAVVAAAVARSRPVAHALGLGVLGLLATVANMLMFPHPAWMWVVGLLAIAVAAYLAGTLVATARGHAGKVPAPVAEVV